MLPYIHIGFRDYPVYGLLMAVGAVLGWLLCRSRARLAEPALEPERVSRIYILFGAGALIGAKLYSLALVWPWLVQDLPHFWENPQLFLQHYLYGGLVFYGGLIGGPQNGSVTIENSVSLSTGVNAGRIAGWDVLDGSKNVYELESSDSQTNIHTGNHTKIFPLTELEAADSRFYMDTLGWSGKVWNFEGLAEGRTPALR